MSGLPNQAAWNEVRALLAAAEDALSANPAPELGSVVARTDAAIALLERVRSAAPHGATRRMLGTAWSIRGRALERVGTPAALDDAVRSLDTAIERLDELPGDPDPNVRRDLALVLNHAGTLRQHRRVAADHAAAIANYDRAIELLRSLPLETNPALRQLLGGVWFNRGTTWASVGDSAGAHEAVRSFDEAIAVWRSLPEDVPLAQRINLAMAGMNRAHVLLRRDSSATGATLARDAASNALLLVHEHEREQPAAAEVGMKSRHIICRALGAALAATGTGDTTAREELFAAASDCVDDGLAVARHWAKRGLQLPLDFVRDLLRFGTQIYLARQPHFLAEFVLENLDPQAADDALPFHPDLHAIASDAVARALQELERPKHHTIDTPDAERRIQALHDLRAAAERLSALRGSSES